MNKTKNNKRPTKQVLYGKFFAFFITAILVLCMIYTLPMSVSAISIYDDEFDLSSASVTIDTAGTYRIYQTGYTTTPTTNTITVNEDCTIYLDGVNIAAENASSSEDYNNVSPIDIALSKSVTVILVSGKENRLEFQTPADAGSGVLRGSSRAALRVPATSTLTIEGSGPL